MSEINLSRIKHELRTPINHIIGYSEMLQEEAEDQGFATFLTDLRRIRESGQQLLDLVNECLETVATETGRTRPLSLYEQLHTPVHQIISYINKLKMSAQDQAQSAIIPDLQKICTAATTLLDLADDFEATTQPALSILTMDSENLDAPLTSSLREENVAPPVNSSSLRSAFAKGGLDGVNEKGCLLVVDDNVTTRHMLCRRLERQGHQVSEAENGRRALEMVRTCSFDLVLLDLMMPEVNGYQVLEQLKSDDLLRHIPVIMLSGLEEVDSTVRCIEMGAEDYLIKPFNPVLLKARIDACLEKKLLRDQEVRHLQEIESMNSQLEKRVEERVKELRRSNSRLMTEVSERKRLEEQLQNKIAEMAVVDEIARIITSNLNIDQSYEQFALEMRKLLQFDRISINVIDYDSYTYCLKYLFGNDMLDRQMGEVVLLSGSQTEHVMRTRQTIIREDASVSPTFEVDRVLAPAGLRSSIMAPLISKDRVIGSIGLRSHQVGIYQEREQIILERLAKQIAPALENAHLYEETSREKERATTALAQLRALLDGVDAGILLVGNDDETVLWDNQRFAEFFGIPSAQSLMDGAGLCQTIREISRPCLANADEVFEETDKIYSDRHYSGTDELELINPDRRTIQRFTTPILDELGEYLGRLWVYYDVTDQRKLEDQLVQSHKMESIGRLAGGIAHDFNNLLTPIMGYATLGSMYLTPEHPAQGHLEEVKKAAERASGLTHQLLAFSKGQVIEPKVIDLNNLVFNLDELLRRLIGEDIELVILPTSALDMVKVDPGQIEQVMLNLVINARDAMPQGGKLTVATSNASLDTEYVRQHPDAVAGDYVVLSVADTGVGISEAVRAHLFEPFFTTKEQGKGTGLGLATCYGIVEQSGGRIQVDSELGVGTTFRIYLPITDEVSATMPTVVEDKKLPRGTETVLLVEDEPAVRCMVATILENQGYTVLQAANGDEAMKVSEGLPQTAIDLLLTDVVMPQMGGVELVKRFSAKYPNIKVIFTSGYPDQPIVTGNNQRPAIEFIQKPFMPAALATKVRKVLDKP